MEIGWIGAIANGLLAATIAAIGLALLWMAARILGLGWPILRRVGEIESRLVARATSLAGTRRSPPGRWATFAAVAVGCEAAAAAGPPLIVLAALTTGFTFMYVVVRDWVWSEEDREARNQADLVLGMQIGAWSREPRLQTGTGVDLTSEVLACFLLLFLLAGTGFSRLDQWQHMLTGASVGAFGRAGAYVVAEVIEATPILDATGVFRPGNLTGIAYQGVALESATFVLRLAYELFLVAAALRLASMLRRVSSTEDLRRFTDMLASDNVSMRFDALEALAALAGKGRENAVRELVRVARNFRDPPPDAVMESHRIPGLNGDGEAAEGLPARACDFAIYERKFAADALHRIGAASFRDDLLSDASVTYADLRAMLDRERNAPEWAELSFRGADALLDQYTLWRDESLAEIALGLLTNALHIWEHEKNAAGMVRARARMAVAHTVVAKAQSTVEGYEEAVKQIEEALGSSAGASKAQLALQHHSLGVSLIELGLHSGELGHVERAAEVLRVSLKLWSRHDNPVPWATTSCELARALTIMAERNQDGAAHDQAAAHLAGALQVRTREKSPILFAATQSHLGDLCAVEFKLMAGNDWLRSAILAYRHALEGLDTHRMHVRWVPSLIGSGLAQIALGRALSDAGLVRSGVDSLEMAMTASPRYLKSKLFFGLGDGYQFLSNAVGANFFQESVAAYGQGFKAWIGEVDDRWSAAMHNRGTALFALYGIEEEPELLNRALESYQAAMDPGTRRRESNPALWAQTQHAIGTVHASVGSKSTDLEHYRLAIDAFSNAAAGWDKTEFPELHARCQYDLGLLIRLIGFAEFDSAKLKDALSRFDEATPFYVQKADQETLDSIETCRGQIVTVLDLLERAAGAAPPHPVPG